MASDLQTSDGWDPEEGPVDYILLMEQRSPGIAVVEGADSPRKWDQAQGYGLSGAYLRYLGIRLSQFKVWIHLYNKQDWRDWKKWRRLLEPNAQGLYPKAMDIWHPFLEELKIKSVGIENVTQPKQTDDGVWTVEIQFIRYRRPTPHYSKPEGSKATTTDPVDKKIDALVAQLSELAK